MGLNSTLNGQHNIPSINVRANILSEWTADQVRIAAQVRRYATGILACAIAVASVVPIAENSRRSLAANEAHHRAELNHLNEAVGRATAIQKATAPGVAITTLRSKTNGYFERLMQEVYAVLDSANSGMAFSSAKAEVRGAQISIDCRADAENFDSAAAFAKQAGSTPNKISNLASLRPSSVLGSHGVAFEYVKRVDVK